ncbi:hypothetical protein E3E33_08405 [Thermococcus sp. GR5]|nr:hypothetical protein [Thermococcus sp. GR5]
MVFMTKNSLSKLISVYLPAFTIVFFGEISLFWLPRDYYIGADCWSLMPPACNFHYKPNFTLPALALIPALLLLLLWQWRRVEHFKAAAMVTAFSALLITTLPAIVGVPSLSSFTLMLIVSLSFPLVVAWSMGDYYRDNKAGIAFLVLTSVVVAFMLWALIRMGVAVAV